MWFSNVNTKFLIYLLKIIIMNGLIFINVFENKLSRNPKFLCQKDFVGTLQKLNAPNKRCWNREDKLWLVTDTTLIIIQFLFQIRISIPH